MQACKMLSDGQTSCGVNEGSTFVPTNAIMGADGISPKGDKESSFYNQVRMDEAMNLKDFLFKKYGNVTGKLLKELSAKGVFIVDDRGPRDKDSRGKLFPWFCSMSVKATGNEQLIIHLYGSVPHSSEFEKYILEQNGKWERGELESNLSIRISSSETSSLRELASRMQTILRGRYEVPSYKYVVPRTAASLIRLAEYLDEYNNSLKKTATS